MKRNILTFSVIAIIVLLSSVSQAETVRGRILRQGPFGIYPAQGIHLTLYSQAIGRSAPAFSDASGMYYFQNVPRGPFVLEIWANNVIAMTFTIMVQQAITDIAPVRISF